ERALRKVIAAITVAGHHGHILQMAFAAFVADRAIMRMVLHHAFDDAGAKRDRVRILNGYMRTLGSWRHARHHQTSLLVVRVAELFDGALPTRAHRTQGRVPA